MAQLKFIIAATLFIFGQFAVSETGVLYKNSDIKPAVDYFEKLTFKLARPITTYTWSMGGAQTSLATLAHTQGESEIFWQNFGQGNIKSNDDVGQGLYVAVDPVVTVDFGKAPGHPEAILSKYPWLLREIKFPSGLRILRLDDIDPQDGSVLRQKPSRAAKAILSKYRCPENIATAFFRGGRDITQNCADFLRFVLRDEIQISAISYQYFRTDFLDCRSKKFLAVAFVITSGEWINDLNFHSFTEQSNDQTNRRLIIQSAFFYNNRQIPRVDFVISEKSALETPAHSLLWPDLAGSKISPIDSWLNEEIYPCASVSPWTQ